MPIQCVARAKQLIKAYIQHQRAHIKHLARHAPRQNELQAELIVDSLSDLSLMDIDVSNDNMPSSDTTALISSSSTSDWLSDSLNTSSNEDEAIPELLEIDNTGWEMDGELDMWDADDLNSNVEQL